MYEGMGNLPSQFIAVFRFVHEHQGYSAKKKYRSSYYLRFLFVVFQMLLIKLFFLNTIGQCPFLHHPENK